MVCARRISIAEELVLEKKVNVKAALSALLDQAEDEDTGTDDSRWDALQKARELAQKNKIDLEDFKAEHEKNKAATAGDEEPDNTDDDDSEESGSKQTPAKKPSFSQSKDKQDGSDEKKKPFGSDDDDEFSDDDEDAAPVNPKAQKDGEGVPSSEPQQHGGETQAPSMPPAGEDAISNGNVTYKVKDGKFGEKLIAIPQAWFDTWLDTKKHSPQELQTMLAGTRKELTKLGAPVNTGDPAEVASHKAKQDGLRNKMKAITTMLSDLEKTHNKDIEGHNKKQERRRSRINDLVDTLSGGNPLLKTLIGLMADRLIKNKDKANYTGQSRTDDFDFGE